MLPIAPQQRVSQKGHGKFKSCATTPQDVEDVLNDSGEERRDNDSQQDDDGEEPEPRGGCDDLESEVCTMTEAVISDHKLKLQKPMEFGPANAPTYREHMI